MVGVVTTAPACAGAAAADPNNTAPKTVTLALLVSRTTQSPPGSASGRRLP